MTTVGRRHVSGIWPILLVLDCALIGAFAVTAALEPSGVLDLELPFARGLVPTLVVLILRASTLWAERRLLLAGNWIAVLACRIGSLVAFFYGARALYDIPSQRWWEVMLGGTLAYAVAGVALTGIALIWSSVRLMRTVRQPPIAAETVPAPEAPSRGRRQLTRQSLLGLIGVFVGVAGLVLNVANITQLAVAVLAGALAVVAVIIATPDRPA